MPAEKNNEKTDEKNGRTIVKERPRLASRNEVRITGSVVGMFQVPGKNILTLTIATNAAGLKANFPKVTWYGEEAKTISESLRISKKSKPQVTVTGYIQTSKSIKDGTARYYQNIVGRSMSLASSYLESVLDSDSGGRVAKHENEVIIVGELMHKFNFNKKGTNERVGTIIKVKTSEGIPNYPDITLYRGQSSTAQKMEKGDTVAVIGHIETDKAVNPETGRMEHRENIVGIDIDWYSQPVA